MQSNKKFKHLNKLTVSWLIGFIDGDGYFGLECVKRKRSNKKIDIYFRPVLAISQNDITILYKIKRFIGCGTVTAKSCSANIFHYRIRSSELFIRFLFPLINQQQFQTSKQLQFDLLKKVCFFLVRKYQPSNKWHQFYLNKVDSKLKKLKRQVYINSIPLTSEWLIGFFEAEGCFYFQLNWQQKLRFEFKITQKHNILLLKIQNFFQCGYVKPEGLTIYCFSISSFDQIENILMPFLEKNKFHSKKNIQKIKWLKACRLNSHFKNVGFFSPTQLNKIKNLKKSFANESPKDIVQ
jgi:hypothetical protein